MNTYRRTAWSLMSGLLIIAVAGLVLGCPAPVAAQTEGTPTNQPPPPRTPPPGPRITPTPGPVEATPGPTAPPPPADTPVPTPAIMPVAGGSPDRGLAGPALMAFIGAASVWLALGLKAPRNNDARSVGGDARER